MIAPSPGGRRAAVWSELKPPQEIPHMPSLPVHHGCSAIQARISSVVLLLLGVLVREDAVGVAGAAHVHPHGRIAVAGQVRLAPASRKTVPSVLR